MKIRYMAPLTAVGMSLMTGCENKETPVDIAKSKLAEQESQSTSFAYDDRRIVFKLLEKGAIRYEVESIIQKSGLSFTFVDENGNGEVDSKDWIDNKKNLGLAETFYKQDLEVYASGATNE